MEKHCLKCLLREMDQDAYFQNLHDLIQNMDADVKAEASLYEERLQICKSCDYLREGMCGACGCYVELRAAVAAQSCPYEHWAAQKKTL